MDIQLNGQPTPVAAGITIGDLIRQKNLDPATIVVEHNLAIITAADLDRITLKENDALEIHPAKGHGNDLRSRGRDDIRDHVVGWIFAGADHQARIK